jgi:tRNA (guanosine-2'-O-)-methyltransferase
LEQCFNAIDDDCDGHVDERCGTPDGLIQLIIAWEVATTDVDLDVTDANGDLATPEAVTQLGFLKDRDCPLNSTCGDQNTETVSSVESGSFNGPLNVTIRIKGNPPNMTPLRVQLGGHLGSRPVSAWTLLANPNTRAEFEIVD